MAGWHYTLLLYGLGLILLYVEIYLPGAVLGILGGLCILSSMIFAFQTYSVSWGILISLIELIGVCLFIFLGVKYLPNSKTGRKLILGHSLDPLDGYTATNPNLSSLAGQTGITLTALRPAGSVKIEKLRYDVVTQGEFIEQNCTVKVVQVEGNRVVVKKI